MEPAYEHADEIAGAGLHILRDAAELARYDWRVGPACWPEIDADGIVVGIWGDRPAKHGVLLVAYRADGRMSEGSMAAIASDLAEAAWVGESPRYDSRVWVTRDDVVWWAGGPPAFDEDDPLGDDPARIVEFERPLSNSELDGDRWPTWGNLRDGLDMLGIGWAIATEEAT